MRTDFARFCIAAQEAIVNERLYMLMQDELDKEIKLIATLNPKLIYEEFDKLYFWRRIISVVRNHDLPYRCVSGLLWLNHKLETLSQYRECFISDCDSDTEVYKYLLEFGYRLFEQKHLFFNEDSRCGKEKVKLYNKPKKKGDENHDE